MQRDWIDRIEAAQAAFKAAEGRDTAWLAADQTARAGAVRLSPFPLEAAQTVAGVDAQYDGPRVQAAAVVLNRITLEPLETARIEGAAGKAYEYGFLAYRELPLILAALARLTIQPDLIFYDGDGLRHPRRFGAACHLGVALDAPVIGVSKNVSAYGPFPPRPKGDARPIDEGVATLLTTRENAKPVCVSPGHRTDLDSALALTLAVSRSRVPEPIRLADQAARS